MKLCPQCDFIYEDDQSVCDMDGKELVEAPTVRRRSENAPLEQILPQRRSHSRSLAVLLVGSAVLATVFCAAYFASPDLFDSRPEASAAEPETQNPKLETSTPQSAPQNTHASGESNTLQPASDPFLAPSPVPPVKPGSGAPSPGVSPINMKIGEGVREIENNSALGKHSAPSLSVLPTLKALPTLKTPPRLKPLPRLPMANSGQKTAKTAGVTTGQIVVSANGNQKEDSRIVSLLKQTGRILKKPFRKY